MRTVSSVTNWKLNCVRCNLTFHVCKLYSCINYTMQIVLCITYGVKLKAKCNNKTEQRHTNIFFQCSPLLLWMCAGNFTLNHETCVADEQDRSKLGNYISHAYYDTTNVWCIWRLIVTDNISLVIRLLFRSLI